MHLVTFDISMRTGWARGKPGAQPDFGHFKLTPCKGDYGALACEFEFKVAKLIRPGDLVAYENPIIHPNNTQHVNMITCGLAMQLERICNETGGITYTTYYPKQVKEILSGHGYAKKKDMVNVAKRLGFDVAVHDEADAIGVWYRLLAMYDRMHQTNHLTKQLDPLFRKGS